MSALRTHDVTLTGERVVLRPMTEHDWSLIEAIKNEPEVGYFSEEDEWTPYTLKELQRIYRSMSENALVFVIEHEGEAVGECWLQRMNVQRILDEFPGRDVRRIDIAIGAKHLWDQGLGSEAIRLLVELAFDRERVDLLVCFTGGHNPRSQRAFEKAGFTVLRKVPDPDDRKAGFGYDLLLTRERYEQTPRTERSRCRTRRAAPGAMVVGVPGADLLRPPRAAPSRCGRPASAGPSPSPAARRR